LASFPGQFSLLEEEEEEEEARVCGRKKERFSAFLLSLGGKILRAEVCCSTIEKAGDPPNIKHKAFISLPKHLQWQIDAV
jgi:hypothetical protein